MPCGNTCKSTTKTPGFWDVHIKARPKIRYQEIYPPKFSHKMFLRGFVCLAAAGLAFTADAQGATDLDQHTHIFVEAGEAAASKTNTFATLTAARDAIRAGLGQNTTRTVFVAGEHFLEGTFELGPEDSGTHQHPIN